MLSKKQIIGLKSESTQGTSVSPLTATDYFLASNADIKPIVEMLPREFEHMTLGQLSQMIGQVYVEVKFTIRLQSGGAKGTIWGPIDAILQAAGMTSTPSAGVSVTYAFTSNIQTNFATLGKSATVEFYQDANSTLTGHKWVIAGAIVTALKMSCDKAGHPVSLDVTMHGLYTAAAGGTGPATVTYSSILPPILQSAALSLDGQSFIASKFDLDFGLKEVVRDDLSSAYGIKGFQVVGRAPKLTLDPEMPLVGTYDVFGKWIAGNQGALSVAIGSASGNTITITAPKVQYDSVAYGDRGGIRTAEVTGMLNENTGDDELSIVLT